MSSPSIRAICCERSAAKAMPAGAALLGVAEHRLGVVGADQHQVEPADPVGDRLELDQPGLAHRAGVEGARSGCGRRRWCRRSGRCAGPRRCGPRRCPRRAGPARRGTRRSRRPRRRPGSGAVPSRPMPKQMLGADPATADVERVDQEGERDRVQLVGDQLVGETAGEGHQVVGGDGAGDCDTHDGSAPCDGRRWPAATGFGGTGPPNVTGPPQGFGSSPPDMSGRCRACGDPPGIRVGTRTNYRMVRVSHSSPTA